MDKLSEEDRTGCYSDSDDNKQFVQSPMCPKCGSKDYQLLPLDIQKISGHNCQCSECGWRYDYNF